MDRIYRSILFENNTTEACFTDFNVFESVKLTSVLRSQTLETLLRSCSENDIKYRHEVFSELLYSDLIEHFEVLAELLSKMDQSYDRLDSATSLYAKYVCSYDVCMAYAAALRYVLDIKSNMFFIARLQNEIKCAIPQIKRIESDLALYSEEISAVKTVIFSLTGLRLRLGAPKDAFLCLGEMLEESAKKLDLFDESRIIPKQISLPDYYVSELEALYRDELDKLKLFYEKYIPKLDREILKLKNELRFYIAVCGVKNYVSNYGVPVCIPHISDKRDIIFHEAYDITLTYTMKKCVVANDISFTSDANMYFLIGTNGGGKTTFLRALCINLIFANAGCPVFARDAEMSPINRMYTHFPVDEASNSGRFAEECDRINNIISSINANDFVLLNETFSGTNMQRGTDAALDVARKIKNKNANMLFVTHFQGVKNSEFPILITESGFKIAKYVSTNTSFAVEILKKYGLSKENLTGRENNDA